MAKSLQYQQHQSPPTLIVPTAIYRKIHRFAWIPLTSLLVYAYVYLPRFTADSYLRTLINDPSIPSLNHFAGGRHVQKVLYADAVGSARILLEAAQTPRPIFDEDWNEQEEVERCKRYNLKYAGRQERRRIFWGSLIADDSWHTISIAALETYGLFHTGQFYNAYSTIGLCDSS